VIICFNKQRLYNIIFTAALIFTFWFFANGSGEVVVTNSTPVTGRVIVVDPGHGSPDGGASGVSGALEKDYNLAVAKKLGNLLLQSGAHVIYTREDDNSVADNLNQKLRNVKREDMKKRRQIRDNTNADMFVSIHMNSGESGAYSGAQVFYQHSSAESRFLAESIQRSIKSVADKSNTREAKDSNNSIFILNDSKIPSVLVECGFISNKEEESKLKTDSYQEKIAFAIYGGILEYINS